MMSAEQPEPTRSAWPSEDTTFFCLIAVPRLVDGHVSETSVCWIARWASALDRLAREVLGDSEFASIVGGDLKRSNDLSAAGRMLKTDRELMQAHVEAE